MQLDERMLSSCDITGLVKNVLSPCVRSVPFTSISRSRYHCRRRTCNLTVISSPRKSSNRPFWSTMRIIRSIMICSVRWSAGKWSAPASPISYILEARENSCIMCALLPLLYAPVVTLHSTRITFTFIMLIDTSDSCHLRGRCTLRRESQQWSNAVGFAKVYSVCTSNLASHHIVVCAKYNRVFSTFTILVIGVIVVVVVVVVVIVTMHYVNGFKRRDVVSRVSKIHLCLALHMNPREL